MTAAALALALAASAAPALSGSARADLRPQALVAAARRWPALSEVLAQWLLLQARARVRDGDQAGAAGDFSAAVEADAHAACFDPILGPDELGLPFFDACFRRFPSDARLYCDRGVARYRSRQTDGAVADFRRALSLRADFPEASLSLATALIDEKRTTEAAEVVRRALASRPAGSGASQVYGGLEDLRRSLGRDSR